MRLFILFQLSLCCRARVARFLAQQSLRYCARLDTILSPPKPTTALIEVWMVLTSPRVRPDLSMPGPIGSCGTCRRATAAVPSHL